MTDSSVLEIAFLAEKDWRVVGPDDRTEPDAGASSEADVANQVGGRRDPCIRADGRAELVDGV